MKWFFALLLTSSLLFASLLIGQDEKASDSKSVGNRVFEMRTYHCNPGKLQALHTRFREHTNAIFVKHGMTLVGYWVPEDQEEVLVYMLAYPSKEARKQAWDKFGADPAWKKAFAESRKDGALVKKVDSKFLSATDYSPIQ